MFSWRIDYFSPTPPDRVDASPPDGEDVSGAGQGVAVKSP
jgi:hypothetical protein